MLKENSKNSNQFDLQLMVDKAVMLIGDRISTIIKEVNSELLKVLKNNLKYEVEIVDVGYDVSEHARPTGKRLDILDYVTVKDFLEESTGNTVPTYISGAGLRAETYEDYFQDLIMRKKYDIAEEVFKKETNIDTSNMSDEERMIFDDFNDAFCDSSIEIEQNIFETFSGQKIYSIF
jgi:hypothetical protein